MTHNSSQSKKKFLAILCIITDCLQYFLKWFLPFSTFLCHFQMQSINLFSYKIKDTLILYYWPSINYVVSVGGSPKDDLLNRPYIIKQTTRRGGGAEITDFETTQFMDGSLLVSPSCGIKIGNTVLTMISLTLHPDLVLRASYAQEILIIYYHYFA